MNKLKIQKSKNSNGEPVYRFYAIKAAITNPVRALRSE